jgi:hypothetical protein
MYIYSYIYMYIYIYICKYIYVYKHLYKHKYLPLFLIFSWYLFFSRFLSIHFTYTCFVTHYYVVNSIFNLIKLQYYKLVMSYAKQTNNNGYNYELFKDRDWTNSTQLSKHHHHHHYRFWDLKSVYSRTRKTNIRCSISD